MSHGAGVQFTDKARWYFLFEEIKATVIGPERCPFLLYSHGFSVCPGMSSELSQLSCSAWLCFDAPARRGGSCGADAPGEGAGKQSLKMDSFLETWGTRSTERIWAKTPGKWFRRTPNSSPATRPKVVPLGSPPSYLRMASCDNSGQTWTGRGEETGMENVSRP